MTLLYAQFTGSTLTEVARQKKERRPLGKSLPQPPDSILPWEMEELPDTTWRCVHTYEATTVDQLKENREGRLGPDPDEWINAIFSLGLWRGDKFCIEHWVRVDHLSAQIQIEWATERVAYCRKQLLQWERQSGESPTYQRQRIEGAQDNLREARRQLTSLADELDVTITTDLLNVGVQPSEQLVLL